MRKLRWLILFVLGIGIWLNFIPLQHALSFSVTQAQTPKQEQLGATKKLEEGPNKPLRSFAEVTADTEKLTGLFTLYRQPEKGKVYLEIKPEQLNQDYLCFTSLSTGIGESFLLSGLALGDFLFRFRRLQNKVQFVLPNINFRTEDINQKLALERSFSDSVLYSLPIVSIDSNQGSLLVDLGKLFLTDKDIPGLNQMLPYILGSPYTLDASNSYFSEVEAFPSNLEIESVYGFASRGDDGLFSYLPSLADNRAFNLSVHYSISELPTTNNYIPRLADDRIGYFVTAYKDLSNNNRQDPFVRYINRWQLEPSDPNASLSTPKEPIVFWIDNAVPPEYREAVREGILMWNRAFESAGFKNAIEARQMPDNATWNPADVRYNTIRWSNSAGGGVLGVGPSHINPLTGQILDADIVINANVVDIFTRDYRNLIGLNQSPEISPEQFNLCMGYKQSNPADSQQSAVLTRLLGESDFCYAAEAAHQLNIGALAMSLTPNSTSQDSLLKEYVNQHLTYLIGHEVGHTLGLRHNFHGSTMLKPEELNDTKITRSKGLVGSVMDYVGVNLAPVGSTQGDFFPLVIGPYDKWAIEYGYKPSGERIPVAERRFLNDIAQRAAEPDLAYGTDEDIYGFRDPEVNSFDLSSDILAYSQLQMDNALQMWESLEKAYPQSDQRYSDLRDKFNEVFFYYVQQALFLSEYIGGRSFNRDHPGDPNGRLPFESVPVAKQREALQALHQYVFAKDALNFSPELLNQLAPSRWNHWGHPAPVFSLDYPIHDNIFSLQRVILRSLFSQSRLSSLRDLELKTKPGEALTIPELFETLSADIWSEIGQPQQQEVNISSIRRPLQREHLKVLTEMVLRRTKVPEDARTIAWYQLRQLDDQIKQFLRRHGNDMDLYTKAHLEETRDRIEKTLNAQLQSKSKQK